MEEDGGQRTEDGGRGRGRPWQLGTGTAATSLGRGSLGRGSLAQDGEAQQLAIAKQSCHYEPVTADRAGRPDRPGTTPIS